MIGHTPLAEDLRPNNLDDYIGQEHIVGKDGILRKAMEFGNIPSMILWGPPGVGKTTLAHIISQQLVRNFYTLSAISSGVADVRKVIKEAHKNPGAILFIDEIHRFNKAQQDSLLGAVEKGIITLIGATTENPSFEVISPLLSRCQVYILKDLGEKELLQLMENGRIYLEKLLKVNIIIKEHDALLRISGGDARKLYNALEIVVNSDNSKKIEITNKKVLETIQNNLASYDKKGDMHYDIISAFIKSLRGSDPNASLYWLARMIDGGEDIKFIARRMLILASEDIGLANPTALVIAQSCFDAISSIGYPEGRIILSQTAIYLATSPKSNSAYTAIEKALKLSKQYSDLPVPLSIRNAPTKFMKENGYGVGYKYAHNFQNNFIDQEFLPDKLKGTNIYKVGKNPREEEIVKRMNFLWRDKYEF